MITLQPITERNFLEVLHLRVKPEQQTFVATAEGILARGYLYRNRRSRVWAIYADSRAVGLALIYDLVEEPACYHLCELLVDQAHQGKGYGQAALELLIRQCRGEGKYLGIEVCVKKANIAAIHVYQKAGFCDTGYVDPDTPNSLCLAYPLPQKYQASLDIRLTGKEDLSNVQRLWATPAVMRYVGFPEGLHESMENLEYNWLPWVQKPPLRQHWSIYDGGVYCGEAFYNVDETGLAAMDIKLLPEARGKGIAFAALSHALSAAFTQGNAKVAYVDPNPENRKALSLYAALGFLPARRPAHLEDPGCPYVYLEMTRENWEASHGD